MKIGRNDPCHCGSGKKYKQCHMDDDQRLESLLRAGDHAWAVALDWLGSKHEDACSQAIVERFGEDFLPGEDEEPDEAAITVVVNAQDWLLGDAELDLPDGKRRAIDLVLGQGGPKLDPAERQWLEAVRDTPISVYEIDEFRDDGNVVLLDMLAEHAEHVVWIEGLDEVFEEGDCVAARLLTIGDDLTTTPGSMPFPIEIAEPLCERMLAERDAPPDDGLDQRTRETSMIIATWLAFLASDDEYDEDESDDGEPPQVAFDTYRIRDRDALIERLRARDDLERTPVGAFVRQYDGDDRVIVMPSADEDDKLLLVSQPAASADEHRAWLEGFAGDLVEYDARHLLDPAAAPDASAG